MGTRVFELFKKETVLNNKLFISVRKYETKNKLFENPSCQQTAKGRAQQSVFVCSSADALVVGVALGHLLAKQFWWFCATLELSSYISPYA